MSQALVLSGVWNSRNSLSEVLTRCKEMLEQDGCDSFKMR
jgi:hypothetical protein